VEKVTVLAHELGNLLDASIRCLGLARRSIGSDPDRVATDLDRAQRHLDAVEHALERMTTLVRSAMSGRAMVVSPLTLMGRPIALAEVVMHATEVLSPAADEAGVSITVEIDPALVDLPGGPIYSVILNGVKNAIESIAQVGGGGQIRIAATRHTGRGGDVRVLMEILDDGPGPPGGDLEPWLGPVKSTKPGGAGIGLAICRNVVSQMGGTIELRRRTDLTNPDRPGAVLRIRYEPPSEHSRDVG